MKKDEVIRFFVAVVVTVIMFSVAGWLLRQDDRGENIPYPTVTGRTISTP